jgi:hypothetical protein
MPYLVAKLKPCGVLLTQKEVISKCLKLLLNRYLRNQKSHPAIHTNELARSLLISEVNMGH